MARRQKFLLDRIPFAGDLADSRKPLSALIPIVFALVVLWQGLPALIEAYRYGGTGDFNFLVNAGRVVQDDASRLYDWVDMDEWRGTYGYIFPVWYPYPAGVAYLTIPFTLVEKEQAVFALRALMALSTLYVALLVGRSFDSKAWGFAMGAAVVVWEPNLLNGRIGQLGMFVTLGVAVAAKAYMRDRIAGAMLFGLLALKPSIVLGPALAVSLSKPKVWPYFVVAALGVLLVPFIIPGPHALGEWLRVLYERSTVDFGGGHRYNQGLSSFLDFRGVFGVLGLAILGSSLFLAGRRVQSRLGLEVATAFAILVGFLLNPHSLLYDWGVAFVALYLLRSSPLVRGPYGDFAVGLLGMSLFVAGQLAWHWSSLTAVVNAMTIWALAVLGVVMVLAFLRKPLADEELSLAGLRSDAPLPRPEPS